MGLESEISEQPQVLKEVARRWSEVRDEVKALGRRDLAFVSIVARGSSDNAGLYGKYLLGIRNRLSVAMALPSLFTMYKAPPRLDRSLVIGISQSGRSPDIVEALAEAKRQGAATLVITNTPDSPLGALGDVTFDVGAGEEKAIAATKTYTAQLMALALLSATLADDEEMFRSLDSVSDLAAQCLEENDDATVEESVQAFGPMAQCVVLGRGYNYATAYEWSLKLKELAYVLAEPYSSADFQHGPIAVVEKGFPVLAVMPEGPCRKDLVELVDRLETEKGAKVLELSSSWTPGGKRRGFKIPSTAEWLTPLLTILPAQRFCYHLTKLRGLDPEHPRGLNKVTLTE